MAWQRRIGPAAEPLVDSSRAVDEEAARSKDLDPDRLHLRSTCRFSASIRIAGCKEVITRLSDVSRGGQHLPGAVMDGVAKQSRADDEGLDADPLLPGRVTTPHVTPHTRLRFFGH